MLLRHYCQVKRSAPVGTNGRHQQAIIYASVKALFIPMSSRYEVENGFGFGSGYDVYCQASADIKTGDQLVWDGATFNVRAVRSYKGVGSVSHTHVLATREGL